jgi:hypothetical protein
MKTKQEFEASLETIDGWKMVAPKFLLFFGGPKKPFAIYSQSTEKKVVDCNVLAHYKHEESNYYVTAFSTKGEVPIETLAALQDKAQNLDLGSVRFEAVGGNNGLDMWWEDFDGESSDRFPISNNLSDTKNDIYVKIIADIDCQKNYVFVIYSLHEGKRYFGSVPDSIL